MEIAGIYTALHRARGTLNMKLNETEFFPQLNNIKDSVNWSANLIGVLSKMYRNIAQVINNKDQIVIETQIVLRSPNGHYWAQKIDNTGTVTWTDLGITSPEV